MSEPIPNQLSSMAPATGPTPPPQRTRGAVVRSFASSVIGRIVIIAVIAVGAFVVRNYLSGSASDLRVGDCFDVPTVLTTVEEVQHHPCNESHTGEVFAVFDYDAPDDAPYPGEDAIDAAAAETCLSEFTEYTGTDIFGQDVLDVGYFFPTEESWKAASDHEIACYLYRLDKAPTTQSFRNAKP